MKKLACLLLAVLMLTAVLVSCKKDPETPSGSDNSDSSGDSQTKETDKYGQEVVGDLDYSNLDFGGQTISFVSRKEHRYQREFGGLSTREDTVDEKIYARNAKVEKDLNVKINVINDATAADAMWGAQGSSKDGLSNYVLMAHTSGESSGVDIISAYAAYSTSGAIRDCYVNLMGSKMTYLQLSKPYWNQKYIEAASLYNQLYYLVGDMNLGVYDKTLVLWLNNHLLETMDQNTYSLEKLQQMVLDGDWDAETFQTMIRSFGHIDSDNSGTYSDGDTFALTAIQLSEQYDGYAAAFGQIMAKKNAQGGLEFTIEENVLSIQNALDTLRNIWNTSGAYAPSGVGPSFNIFLGNRALFFTEILFRSEDNFSKLSNQTNFTYSVLPLPKYDTELQDAYATTPQDAYTVMSVMNCLSDSRLEAVSAVLDLMCSRSYSDVRPYYIENIVKARYVSDNNSVKIMELILDGVTFDPGVIFGQQTNTSSYRVWRNIAGKTTSVQAQWDSVKSTCNTKLADLNQWYLSKANES